MIFHPEPTCVFTEVNQRFLYAEIQEQIKALYQTI